MNKIKKYILPIISWFIALYLSFASFVLVKIITNDIILNSYKAYSIVKVQWNVIVDKAENIYDKWRLLLSKFTNKEKAKEIEKEISQEEKEILEKKEKLEKELEFNQKVLAWLPYILSIIIFLITYRKVLNELEEILSKINKYNAKSK